MKLMQELLAMVPAQQIESIQVNEGSGDLARHIENWMDDKKMYSMEGPRGVRNFTSLVRALGYDSLDNFLEDNSGALDAMVEWLGTQRNPEWMDALRVEGADEDEND